MSGLGSTNGTIGSTLGALFDGVLFDGVLFDGVLFDDVLLEVEVLVEDEGLGS
jgi:hypothetical protein